MGDVDGEQSTRVDVADCDAHIRLRRAHFVIGNSSRRRFVLEGAIAAVDPKRVRLGVVCDQDVLPAIPIKVRTENTEAGPGQLREPGLDGDILKLRA